MPELGWQDGLDWEVYGPTATGRYRAVLYRRDSELATVTARNRAWLALRMWWVKRRHG